MVDRIRSRNIWGRLTAPARVKKVRRHKERPNDGFQDRLKKRQEEEQKEAGHDSPPAEGPDRNQPDSQATPNEETAEKGRPSKAKNGRHVDIRI